MYLFYLNLSIHFISHLKFFKKICFIIIEKKITPEEDPLRSKSIAIVKNIQIFIIYLSKKKTRKPI